MNKFIPVLILLSLLGCKDRAEEIAFFPVSQECKAKLDQHLFNLKQQYASEGVKVFSQFEYFKLNFPVSSPYIGTVKIFGNNLDHNSKESIANVSSSLCVRTEQMGSENSILGFRGIREYLLTNLKEGETGSIKKQGNKFVVSITKDE